MSGCELVDSFRRRGLKAPVMTISARKEAQVRNEIARKGIEHFLAKPLLANPLLRIVDAVLGESQGAGSTLVSERWYAEEVTLARLNGQGQRRIDQSVRADQSHDPVETRCGADRYLLACARRLR